MELGVIFRPVNCCIIKVSKCASGSRTSPNPAAVTKLSMGGKPSHQQPLNWFHSYSTTLGEEYLSFYLKNICPSHPPKGIMVKLETMDTSLLTFSMAQMHRVSINNFREHSELTFNIPRKIHELALVPSQK